VEALAREQAPEELIHAFGDGDCDVP
jgi:hypothetical protein